ncbi:MAG: AAA family ATPase [Pseudomonadota bacterium]
MPANKARWLRDLLRFLPLRSQFVLSGNVRDLQADQSAAGIAPMPINLILSNALRERHYEVVIFYDPIRGFRVETPDPRHRALEVSFLETVGLTPADGIAAAGLELFRTTLARIVEQRERQAALVVDYGAMLANRTEALSRDEHLLFSQALITSHSAQPFAGSDGSSAYNSVIWLVERESDLPDWLVVDNPALRHIPIPRPDHMTRRAMAPVLLDSLPGGRDLAGEGREEALAAFADGTEGMLLTDMVAIAQLARTERVDPRDVGEAVRRYKVGIAEDPWARIDREKIRNGEAFVHRRVKGQTHAVTHVLDIVKRAVTGVGAPRRGGRPRGVIFLAGPTGVGKTELAKTLTELLFGDASAYIRFDMSEFSAEHSDQRLIGAPPGYVGYDAGGELTNAIRERPFSVVLFDEIEKAHPRILDKFLQVLDDGVLTSGRGERVYFSEAFIVFTSNLGIYREDPGTGTRVPNVTQDDDHATIVSRVRNEIERHFKLVLNRPEILNRLGENVVVFDFIRQELAREIFDAMLDATLADLAENGIGMTFPSDLRTKLFRICTADLTHGGRGIRNQLEAHFINPVARALFDMDTRPGAQLTVADILSDPVPTVVLEPANEDRAR